MGFKIFGYQISKAPNPPPVTPVTPVVNGSSVIVNTTGCSGRMSGHYGFAYDIDGTVRNEAQMINRYREIATYPDCDGAVEQIVNDAVIVSQSEPPVSINLDNLDEQYEPIKENIRKHFDHILEILNFNEDCHDLFKRWYVDGRLYYFVIVDPKNPKQGIIDMKYVDPRKIRKIIDVTKENRDGVDVITNTEEYYVFNDDGLQNAQTGVRITTDSIIDVKSGLVDANSGEVISHLFKAIKPVNQLKMMEDALVIYRITRAPERRVFYVDVGNMPNAKAEQYVNEIMNKFRNKVVYDAATGEVKNNRNYMSMMEDFWLPRREGGKATEISTLPAGCLAMDTEVVLYDGSVITIEQCTKKLEDNQTLWTYSCNPVTGQIVPGLISWAGVTQQNAEVIKINLSNGKSVVCTPDHKFPVPGVGFVRADQLSIGTQLHKFELINKSGQTYVLNDKTSTFVKSDVLFDKCVNDISQSTVMTDEVILKLINYIKANPKTTLNQILEFANTDQYISSLFKTYDNFELTSKSFKNIIINEFNFDNWNSFKKYITTSENLVVDGVEVLNDKIEVGTLTIDFNQRYHDYHTFALACGTFVKNSNLSEISDVEYFQNKLFQSLNVPRQRLHPDYTYNIGSSAEISREEVLFAKFIQRLRNQFNVLFREALRIELLSTKVVGPNDWRIIGDKIFFEYQRDNYFEELKKIEVFNEQMAQLNAADGFKGIYFSKEYIVKNILNMSDDQWQQIKKQMAKEKKEEEAIEAGELDEFGSFDNNEDSFGGDSEESDLDSLENFDDSATETQNDQTDDFIDDQDEQAPNHIEQSGDNTDTLDDIEPNPGDRRFTRPATPGLSVSK